MRVVDHQPEESGDQGRYDHEPHEDLPVVATDGQPCLQLQDEDRSEGDTQVGPGEARCGERVQEQGVACGLEDRVGRDEQTQSGEGGQDGRPFFRSDIRQRMEHLMRSPDSRRALGSRAV